MPAAWRLTAWRAVGSCCSRAERERLAITASRKGGSGRGSGGVGSNLPNGIGPRPVTSGVAARLPGPNSHAGTQHQSGNRLLDPPPDPSVEHLCYTPVPGRSPSATAEYGIPKEQPSEPVTCFDSVLPGFCTTGNNLPLPGQGGTRFGVDNGAARRRGRPARGVVSQGVLASGASL